MSSLSESELTDYLTLAFTPHLGAMSFLRLLDKFKHPETILGTPFDTLKPLIEKPAIVAPHWLHPNIKTDYVTPALAWKKHHPTCHILTLMDDEYPLELSEVYPPPIVLFLRGNPSLLNNPKIAMVGSRNATPQGLATAKNTAEEISRNGLCVVSGMASGIDTAAHQGALLAKGSTITILGTGIDLVYPKSNHQLAHQIAEKGLIISEFPLGTKPNAYNFPIRNRIIAGLGLCTVVVEATLKSGSLITAKLAMEQGKDVMAFPGSIYQQQSKGPHQLIKQGAKLVESAQEIIEDFTQSKTLETKNSHQTASAATLDHDLSAQILEIMGSKIIHPDEISNLLQLSIEEVSSILIMLEITGTIKRTSGGRFQRIIF